MNEPNESSAGRGERAFAIGFWGNGGLAAAKLGAGAWAGSPALVADGWHSLSDLVTNAGVWAAHRFAQKPPDEDHHFGHGNAEALAGVLVGGALVVGGFAVGISGLRSDPHLGAGGAVWLAISVALLSIVVNLGLARISANAGRALGSQGLMALARDNASDALAGVLVLLGILGSRAGLAWAEPVAALMIGVAIVRMGLRSASDGLDVLMDRVADPELRGRLRDTALEVEGVRGVQRVRVHPLGTSVRVDMEIGVEGSLSVVEGHRIAHSVESAVTRAHSAVEEVHVHVNPWRAGQPEPDSAG